MPNKAAMKRYGTILGVVAVGAIALNTAARRFQIAAKARQLITNGV